MTPNEVDIGFCSTSSLGFLTVPNALETCCIAAEAFHGLSAAPTASMSYYALGVIRTENLVVFEYYSSAAAELPIGFSTGLGEKQKPATVALKQVHQS
eukprot:3817211-Amphidinium_carterae.1